MSRKCSDGGALCQILLIILLGADVAMAAVIPDNFLEADTMPMYAYANHPQPPSLSLWGSTNRPLPTNSWWMNFVLDMGEGVVAPLPFHVRMQLQLIPKQ